MTLGAARWRRLAVVLGALLGMALTAGLGRWQLSRAEGKLALEAAMVARERMPALDGATLAAPPDAGALPTLLHRRVVLRGRWLAPRTLYLDNRPMDRQTGFYVFTPLQLAGRDAVVLVQRGWAPRNQLDRTALPPVQTPEGEVELSGRIAAHPPRVFQLGAEQQGAIRQNLDLDALRAETGLPLAPLIVQELGAPSQGLRRDWPAPATGVERHYGYAFQWFGLCALIALLLMWFQVVRPLLRTRRH